MSHSKTVLMKYSVSLTQIRRVIGLAAPRRMQGATMKWNRNLLKGGTAAFSADFSTVEKAMGHFQKT